MSSDLGGCAGWLCAYAPNGLDASLLIILPCAVVPLVSSWGSCVGCLLNGTHAACWRFPTCPCPWARRGLKRKLYVCATSAVTIMVVVAHECALFSWM